MTTITKEQIEILKRGIALSGVNISSNDAHAARLVIHDLLNQPEPEPVVWQMKAIFSSNKWVDITKAQCEAVEKTDAYTREPRAVHTRRLFSHPPAPKAITAEDVTDEVVDAVEDAIGMGRGAWDMVDHKELIAATCKTIGQAPIALALLTIDEVRTAYINANNDGFDFEGQLQKAFCKKNGLPHPTE